MKQTILGSGGAIGKELAKALPAFTSEIRLVSRKPEKVNPTDELFPADILDISQLEKAIKGSSIVYLTIGLPYNLKIWKKEWPKLMANVIKICAAEKCKLVFFDNIYMYDANSLNGMDENTPINPPSEKGKVRAEVARYVMEAIETGRIEALIARSADFYGPSVSNTSMLTEIVFKPFSKGKKANWIGSAKYKHSFTFTADAGKATALLGNTEDAYGQVWHLPTAAFPPTGKEFIELIAKEMGVEPKFQVAPKFLVRGMGIFMSIMREMVEMTYQYDRDYVFDSSKFEKRFDLHPTSYTEGIREIVKKDYSAAK